MKIVYYCQHVLGIGHFFRSLEICKALSNHRVILVTGGDPVDAALPDHVTMVRLPGLMMDDGFKALRSADGAANIEQVRRQRRNRLFGLVADHAPDVLIVELYPFGRKAFAFELDPVLAAIRQGDLPPCKVVCSLRDILVEKADPLAYETRVVDRLNRFFDALLVHADPVLVRLEETFSRVADIAVPVVYTGFVAPPAPAGARDRVRADLGLKPEEALIVVSAGGGAVGGPLLEAAVRARDHLKVDRPIRMVVFTGPYLAGDIFAGLVARADDRLHVARFTARFMAYLCAADLSISMGGYNTTMNILGAAVPALVYPFGQNREQGMRALRLAEQGLVKVIDDADLNPAVLAGHITKMLAAPRLAGPGVDLGGAAHTAAWLEAWVLGNLE